MAVFIIFAIGCFFGAFLFNFNVSWGDKGAREIRNALAVAGGILLFIPIIHAIVLNSGNVGQVMLIGAVPLTFIGLFLGVFAILGRSNNEKTFKTAFKGAVTLLIIALVLAIIGAIITFAMKGGAQ